MTNGASHSFLSDINSVRRSNLVDEVIVQLRDMIESRKGQAGDRLPSEAEMAKSFGVGRSTLREAIRVLAHLGLVESRSGSGTFITGQTVRAVQQDRHVTLRELRHTLDFRYGVEIVACKLAAASRSESQMTDIRASWSACSALDVRDDYDGFARRDYAFHRAIVAASQNRLLLGAFESAAEDIQRASRTLLQLGPIESMLHFHDDLVNAIARREVDGAEQAVRKNLDDVGRRIRMLADLTVEPAAHPPAR